MNVDEKYQYGHLINRKPQKELSNEDSIVMNTRVASSNEILHAYIKA